MVAKEPAKGENRNGERKVHIPRASNVAALEYLVFNLRVVLI